MLIQYIWKRLPNAYLITNMSPYVWSSKLILNKFFSRYFNSWTFFLLSFLYKINFEAKKEFYSLHIDVKKILFTFEQINSDLRIWTLVNLVQQPFYIEDTSHSTVNTNLHAIAYGVACVWTAFHLRPLIVR